MKSYPFSLRLLIYLLLAVVILFIMTIAKDFLVPICFAILFSYLLLPLARLLEKRGIPRIPTNVICILSAYVAIGGLFYIFSTQVAKFIADLPNIQRQAEINILAVEQALERLIGMQNSTNDGWLLARILTLLDFSGQFLTDLFTSTTKTFTQIALIPIYVFLFLFYREKFYSFLQMLFPEEHYATIEKITVEIKDIAKSYMGGILIVVAILVVLNSTGLLLIGIQHAIFLGVLSAAMNAIPYIGTLLGAAIPIVFALVAEDSLSIAVAVLGFFIIIQFLENNILTPNITGSKVNINPMVTIMTVIAGGMVWGIAGMFIFLPFLAMFKVICNNVERLKPIAFLLGTEGTEKHSITFVKLKRIFITTKVVSIIPPNNDQNPSQ